MKEIEVFNLALNTIIKEVFNGGPVPVSIPGDGSFCINATDKGFKWMGETREGGIFQIKIINNSTSEEFKNLFIKNPAYVLVPFEIVSQIRFMKRMVLLEN